MEHSSVTADMVTEAGIAAAIVADSNMLPPEISELSDQAAVFASDSTAAFKFTGGADADSASTNFGTSLAAKAVEHMIELEAKRRKEDDPAGDAGMITELAARQRQEAVSFANGTYYLNGMAISEEEMDESLAMTRAELDDIAKENNWTDSQKARAERVLDRAENTTGEERSDILSDADNSLPGLTDAIGENVREIRGRAPDSKLSGGETQDANVTSFTSDPTWQSEQEKLAKSEGYSESESSEIGNRATAIATNVSNEANPFPDTRSPSSEFNAQASGDVQLAEATPLQTTPVVSGAVLSNG